MILIKAKNPLISVSVTSRRCSKAPAVNPDCSNHLVNIMRATGIKFWEVQILHPKAFWLFESRTRQKGQKSEEKGAQLTFLFCWYLAPKTVVRFLSLHILGYISIDVKTTVKYAKDFLWYLVNLRYILWGVKLSLVLHKQRQSLVFKQL